MAKRVMDIVVSSVLLLVLSPLLFVLALLVKLYGGKGPVLLRQERMTLDGKTFDIFKFRTMVDGPRRKRGRSSRPRTTRAARRSARGCAAATSTSCRSC